MTGGAAPMTGGTRVAAGPLSGRAALVTGGAKGIGRAIADALAAAGAQVAVFGRDAEALHTCGHEHRQVDVTDGPAFARAIADLFPLDILVNNAGAAFSAPFARHDRAAWDAMLAVNLTACFTACQAVLPAMRARGQGRIVSIASTAGLKGYAYTAAYCAAKHGLIGLTRALAIETAREGITVNAVCPGFTDTDMVARAAATIAAKTGQTGEDARAALARLNPQNRLTTPAEVAEAVLFLCQDSSAGFTGQALVVAGGEVM
jgi:NAD(P)-dependent dehydrogenase (short-subunit alcohol dehydrogenase family)